MSSKANDNSVSSAESLLGIAAAFLPPSVEDENNFPPTISRISLQSLSENDSGRSNLEVPPPTPASNLSFGYNVKSLPEKFPDFKSFQIPYIREKGVKESLEILSVNLGCPDYKHNPIQFWFLDVVADCLWRMQDEYQFPDQYQKIIIEWMLYVFELIRDSRMNFSRKKFFTIFNQTMVLVEDYIKSESEIFPTPTTLFSIMVQNEEATSLWSSVSGESESSSLSSSDSQRSRDDSYIAIVDGTKQNQIKLPKNICIGDDLTWPSSSESSESSEKPSSLGGVQGESSSDEEFYKPNFRTPPRFESLSNSTKSTENENESNYHSLHFMWKSSVDASNELSSLSKVFAHQETENLEQNVDENIQNNNKTEIVQMNSVEIDANQFPSTEGDDFLNFRSSQADELRAEWNNYLENRMDLVKKGRRNVFLNCCALFAIKQFVVDYFYESFQFTLARLAFIGSHNLITQRINDVWNVPKSIRDLLKKPKIKKDKKKKKEKSKKKKKTKTKARKKKTSSTRSKSSKKSKTSKRKNLTKAEKAELRRLKKEELRLEEEKRLSEMNRRLLFPLQEAADDDFYKTIFDHWVKPKKKGKKGKNENKSKK